MEVNPDEAPVASLANPNGPAVSAVQRSWWASLRWLPLAFCALVTLNCLLYGALQLFLLAQLLIFQREPITPHWSDELTVGLAFPLALGLTALGIRTVQHWYRCHWKPAVRTTLIFFVLTILGDSAFRSFMPIRSAPPVIQPRNRVQP